MLIRKRLPDMQKLLEYKANFKYDKQKTRISSFQLASPKLKKLSPTMSVLMHSPYIESLKKNVESKKIGKYTSNKPTEEELPPSDFIIPIIGVDPISLPNKPTDVIEMDNAERKPNTCMIVNHTKKVDLLLSPSTYLGKTLPQISMAVCSCGKFCELGKSICINCGIPTKPEITGFLYIKKDHKLKRFWFKMLNSNLYTYDNKTDTTHSSMMSLQGTVIKEEMEEILDDKTTLHPFSLFSGNQGKIYYAIKEEEKTRWLKAIREHIGCFNFSDYYDIRDVIGKGKFGLVRKAIHKATQKEVAFKIMRKSNMKALDLELMGREIEILKICQHPNIIRLLDIFENSDYLFIVMECLKGGDLFAHLEKLKFQISEERAASFAYSIIVALSYLHSYGIAHRDLKPENILLINDAQDSDIKLMDFGLSKIIAPDEKSVEPFGTLSYVAPEVLKTLPYGKSVDMWSLGVISYLMISGSLPFDDDNDSEVARLIKCEEPTYTRGKWKNSSQESIDFTKKLLCKDVSKRMSIEDAIKHPWINKHSKIIKDIRKKNTNDEIYKPVLPTS